MIPALCCECGTLRQASRQAFRSPDVIRKLKCATCGTTTVHAGVWGRGDDWREEENARKAAPDPFEAVRALGTRVHWIDGLAERAIYCAEQDVAFVRAGLDEEARRSVSAWILGEVASTRKRTTGR